jgi:hypothetical protein
MWGCMKIVVAIAIGLLIGLALAVCLLFVPGLIWGGG